MRERGRDSERERGRGTDQDLKHGDLCTWCTQFSSDNYIPSTLDDFLGIHAMYACVF